MGGLCTNECKGAEKARETHIIGSLLGLKFCTADRPRQRAGLSASPEKCSETAQLRVDLLEL